MDRHGCRYLAKLRRRTRGMCACPTLPKTAPEKTVAYQVVQQHLACHPDRISEFQDGVGTAIECATALGCQQVNCLAGIVPPQIPSGILHRTLVDTSRLLPPSCRTSV